MPHLFFFSYASSDYDGFVRQFFDDLSDTIRRKLGLPKKEEVGFIDEKNLQGGETWEPALGAALQNCPTMVCLYSQGYFNSTYCGKEWEVFQRRRQKYVDDARREGRSVAAPPVIKPVMWYPWRSMPPAVAAEHYTIGERDAPQNTEGVWIMRKQYNTYEAEYDSFLKQLSDQIIGASKLQLPRLNPLPDLSSLAGFGQPSPAAPPPQAARYRGPRFVKFIFFAAAPDEFGQWNRRPDPYRQNGRAEWKPFYPDPRPIKFIADSVINEIGTRALTEEQMILSSELVFTDKLAEEIRDVEKDRSMAVIFIDCWTAALPTYSQALRALDRERYFNCSIFIPWNLNDAELTPQRRERLEANLRQIFLRSYESTNNPNLLRASITSEAELRKQLEDTIRALQSFITQKVMGNPESELAPGLQSDIFQPRVSASPDPNNP